MVCMALSHRMNRTRDEPGNNALAVPFYRYRAVALRSLNAEIDDEHKRTSDTIVAGIITLLLTDYVMAVKPVLTWHKKGTYAIQSIAAIGNTTSPASQLSMTSSHLDELDFLRLHSDYSLPLLQMCPPALFGEVVKINHLRTLGVLAQTHGPSSTENLCQEAYGILSRVCDFSSEKWADSKLSSTEDWILLGNVYRAAVSIYCISSLQSLAVLPSTIALEAQYAALAQLLHLLLKESLLSPRLKSFMLWPLVVLGVESVRGGVVMRAFVKEQLVEMSRHAGTYVPLTAKGVLETFWASGNTSWDSCFDKPYAFTTRIAVDMSRILLR
ncbi:predicted protein [Uncinocarpus reesii 1704]|uniref:C6 transcription factor n=1 Tax=Uncinocarpus reesii (strain UAMH 1704) TaxID=336963 RepID=C4JU78_UNCRE|nr:uncharacterized protein UREG_06017 [Uncinocarpus reesii 1704]EEP81175.1 predicted protein [Uncinocarpus reesii 1704]